MNARLALQYRFYWLMLTRSDEDPTVTVEVES